MSRNVLMTGGAGFIGSHVADAFPERGDRVRLGGEPLTVFGDGAQTRDSVYVGDLVAANLVAADLELPPAGTALDARAYNVGTGREPRTPLLEGLRNTLNHIEREIVAR